MYARIAFSIKKQIEQGSQIENHVIHSFIASVAGVGGAHRQQHSQLEEAENDKQLFFVGITHINH